MATLKNFKKTGKKRIKSKGGAKKQKTVRGGMNPNLATYSPFHDPDQTMTFFKRAITLLYTATKMDKKLWNIGMNEWYDDLEKNKQAMNKLKLCRDNKNRSLLYRAIEHVMLDDTNLEIFNLISILIKKFMFKPEIDDIKMEIKVFLYEEPYFESTVYTKHNEIMDLMVTEDAPNVDLNYIIEIATHYTPNILIILTMLKEKGKLSINSVSEEKQRKLLLILLTMNESDYYIIHFDFPKYFKLLEFIISTFNIDLNKFEGFDTILHIMVKDYFTTLKDIKVK